MQNSLARGSLVSLGAMVVLTLSAAVGAGLDKPVYIRCSHVRLRVSVSLPHIESAIAGSLIFAGSDGSGGSLEIAVEEGMLAMATPALNCLLLS